MEQDLFQTSSLKILRPRSLEMLGLSLNSRKLLTSEDGKLRDYRGLAEEVGVDDQIGRIESSPDHVREIVTIWCRMNEMVSVQMLVDALEAIDRCDTADDARDLLRADCEAARNQGLLTTSVRRADALTMQDLEAIQKGEPLAKYHAIVLHGEDPEDEALGLHLAERLEQTGKKVFLPQRDLVAGTIEHAASVEIIEKRCDRAVIIFSPSFLKSSINKLYTDLAQFVGLKRQRAVIIPVMFKRCDQLPANLNMITKLSYDPTGSPMMNFYERLYKTFNIDTSKVPPGLLKYPGELQRPHANGLSSQNEKSEELISPKAVNETTSSTLSKDNLDSVATTISELSACSSSSSVCRRLPDVPTHEPSSSDKEKKSHRRKKHGIKDSLTAFTKVFSGKQKKQEKVAELN